MTVYNRNEVTDKVGIAASTVSKWTKEFNVMNQKLGGMSRYTSEKLKVFETIKQQKAKDHWLIRLMFKELF